MSYIAFHRGLLGRQLFVKLQEKHQRLLEQVLMAPKEFEPPPI